MEKNIKKNKKIRLFVVIATLITGFFSLMLFISCFSESTFFAQLSIYSKTVIKSKYGWSINELVYQDDSSFNFYRKKMREFESSHNVVSKTDFMSFVSNCKSTFCLQYENEKIENVTALNLLDVCTTNSNGFFYGIHVKPLYESKKGCDWNVYSDTGRSASYISLNFAKKIFYSTHSASSIFNVEDVIGAFYTASNNDLKVECVVNNVFDICDHTGSVLEALYGDFFISADYSIFEPGQLSLTICYKGDVISTRDVLYLWKNSGMPSLDSYIIGDNGKELVLINPLLRTYGGPTINNLPMFISTFVVFVLTVSLFFGLKMYKTSQTLILIITILFLFLHTCINVFSSSIELLAVFNPFFGWIAAILFVIEIIICLRKGYEKNKKVS